MNPVEVLSARILIVDDNTTNIALLEDILIDEGYSSIDSESDSRQVAGRCLTTRYDLLLLDVRMPHLDGFGVLDALNSALGQGRHPPVLVLTAQNDRETRLRALAAGAQDFLNKPFDDTEVRLRIHNLLTAHLLFRERSDLTVALERTVDERTQALRDSEQRLQAIMDSAADAILTVDGHGKIELANPAAHRLLQKKPYELPGCNITSLLPDIRIAARHHPREIAVRRADAPPLPLEITVSQLGSASELPHHLVIARDISERKRAEAELRRLAQHDLITELPNRATCLQRIEHMLHNQGSQASGAILALSLQGHHRLNGILGHSMGEKMLRAAAARLQMLLPDAGLIGSWGGSEFVIVLPGICQAQAVVEAGRDLATQLTEPYLIEGHELNIDCQVGGSLYPAHGVDPLKLTRRASMAMLLADSEDPPRFRLFDAVMEEQAADRHRIEHELRHALERNQLELYYQPKIDLETGQVIGTEALMRWRHPELGMVSPMRFIPIAEETGLIVPFGEWAIQQALDDTAALRRGPYGHPHLNVAVNVSARQFGRSRLGEVVELALLRADLPTEALELEITESAIVRDIEQALATLNELRDIGVSLAIDDFGTGYSSLGNLRRLPINTLKIDRSFVNDIVDDPDDAAIAETIVAMSRTLRLKAVAEGVETEQQAAALRGFRCHIAQGYFYAKPLEQAALASFLLGRAGR